VTRLTVFALSAFLAGVAGALYAAQGHSATGVPFDPFVSLLWLAVLYMNPGTGAAQPIFAAVALGVVPAYIDNDAINRWNIAFFGLCAVVVALHEASRTSRRTTGEEVVAERSGSRVSDRLVGSGPAAERLRAAVPAPPRPFGSDPTRAIVAVSLPARSR
jgi:hypothetical protein